MYDWQKIDDSEYRLKDASDQTIAYLIHNWDDRWFCKFYNDDFNIKYGVTFEGSNNNDDIIQLATLWIYDICNQLSDSFHHIRDCLP